MIRRAPRLLGTVLEGLTPRLAPATELAEIQSAWAQAVGPGVAAAATPVAERDGVLTVACAAAVWAHELDLMGPEVVARLNDRLGRAAVRSLRCRAMPGGGAP